MVLVRWLCLFIFVVNGFAAMAQAGFGKEKTGDANPIRVYYFAYDLTQPGIYIGPELDFLWTRHEKIQCETGTKVVDKKLLVVPNFGFIAHTNTAFNLYAGIEFDYQVVYDKGGIFELFVGGGYTHRFGDGLLPLPEQDFETILISSNGAFLPAFGLGTGYDFYKAGFSLPLKLNLRVLSASLEPNRAFVNPCLQFGLTYGRHR